MYFDRGIMNRSYKMYAGTEEEAAAAEAAKGSATTTQTPPVKDEPKFTQAQVDEFMNKRFKKEKEANETLKKEYEKLQQSAGLTAQEKEEYAKKVQELEVLTLSKEDLAKKEAERIQKAAKQNEEKLTGERDLYKNLYSSTQIENAISRAAADPEIKALRPEQMVLLLKNQTRLVQKDVGGKSQFEVAVDWTEGDQAVQIPVKEALKRMKEQPNQFGNLFESDSKGGVGGNNVSSGDGGLNPASYETPEAYRKHRAAILAKTRK